MATDDDNGTPEMARRFTVVPKLTRGPFSYNLKVMDETAIDVLLLRGIITANHHSTLEGFMRRLLRMGFVGIKSPTMGSPVSTDPTIIGDKKAAAVLGMVRIYRRLDKKMGPAHRRSLVNLVLMDVHWPGDDASLLECIKALDDAIAGR